MVKIITHVQRFQFFQIVIHLCMSSVRNLVFPTRFIMQSNMLFCSLVGFAENGEYWRSWYEEDQFESDVKALWETVKPLYQQLHAYVRNILLNSYKEKADRFKSTGHLPAHLLGRPFSSYPAYLRFRI